MDALNDENPLIRSESASTRYPIIERPFGRCVGEGTSKDFDEQIILPKER